MEILREAGLRVERHDDHFPQDTSDEAWLAEVTSRGWVVLTHDAKMRYTSRIRDVVLQRGATVFVLKSGKLTTRELAKVFIATLPAVRRFLLRHEPPFMAKLLRDPHDATRPGRIEMWLPREKA